MQQLWRQNQTCSECVEKKKRDRQKTFWFRPCFSTHIGSTDVRLDELSKGRYIQGEHKDRFWYLVAQLGWKVPPTYGGWRSSVQRESWTEDRRGNLLNWEEKPRLATSKFSRANVFSNQFFRNQQRELVTCWHAGSENRASFPLMRSFSEPGS